MTLSMLEDLDNGQCQSCPNPKGGYTCYECLQLAEQDARDEVIERVKTWIVRRCALAPGVTNAEKALLDELAAELEAP